MKINNFYFLRQKFVYCFELFKYKKYNLFLKPPGVENPAVFCAPNLPSAVHSTLLYFMSPVPIYWYALYISTSARIVGSTA